MTHLIYSIKKLGKTFKLQKQLLKTEMNHNELTGDNYKDKKDIWVDYVKTMFYVSFSVVLDIVKQWKKSLDFQ